MYNSTLLIAFGHKARQGKDFATAALVEAFKDKYDIRRYAFGDELKEEVKPLDQFELCMQLGIPYNHERPERDNPLYSSIHGKQSALLQWYGTEYRRKRDPFYWVNRLRDRLDADKPQIAVISDLRFQNEALFVKSFGGYTVKVTRYGFVDLTRSATHQSEVDLDNYVFDFEINCMDGEVEQLRKDAITVFKMIEEAQAPFIPEIDPMVTLVEGVGQ